MQPFRPKSRGERGLLRRLLVGLRLPRHLPLPKETTYKKRKVDFTGCLVAVRFAVGGFIWLMCLGWLVVFAYSKLKRKAPACRV